MTNRMTHITNILGELHQKSALSNGVISVEHDPDLFEGEEGAGVEAYIIRWNQPADGDKDVQLSFIITEYELSMMESGVETLVSYVYAELEKLVQEELEHLANKRLNNGSVL